ncbi:MAG: aminotransferase class I/II-fold pyridoxal phosphate-dependent enzyme [Hydrogenophilus sp.]|nr:aminotransferase class I/II-fold pyridoxal phosphate-dependent enzyme [Hydrogenophilus sp.]
MNPPTTLDLWSQRFLAWKEALAAESRLRRHTPRAPSPSPYLVRNGQTLLNFGSNDYLGLSTHPLLIDAFTAAVRRWGVGSGASALLTGYTEAHAALEAELAAWLQFPAARLFTSGYAANLAAVTLLLGQEAVVIFADKWVHASLVDGLQLARAAGARIRRYPHSDLAILARWLAHSREPIKVIVTDAVFSMEGEIAPLTDLDYLADRYGALLIIDDAHGIGLLGPEGQGTHFHLSLTPRPNWLWIATFGKALGAAGAAILGTAEAIAWLDQTARTHRYTTALPPAIAETIRTAIRLIRQTPQWRTHLTTLTARLRRALAPFVETHPLNLFPHLLPSITPIQPLIIGSDQQVLRLSQQLAERGIYVPAIRSPTVPPGSARLRISLTAAHTPSQIDTLADALLDLLPPAAARPSFSAPLFSLPPSPPPTQIRAAFGRRAHSYPRHDRAQRHAALALLALLDHHLLTTSSALPPGLLLDAGCGVGRDLPLLHALNQSRLSTPRLLIALDAALPLIAAIPPHFPGIRLVGRLEAVPLPTASLALYWSNCALQWCAPVTALAEAARLLTPGGLFAAAIVLAGTFPELARAYCRLEEPAPLTPLVDETAWRSTLTLFPFRIHTLSPTTLTLYYPDETQLLAAIRGIGATATSKHPPAFTRDRRDRLLSALAPERTANGFPLTYRLLYLLLERKSAL